MRLQNRAAMAAFLVVQLAIAGASNAWAQQAIHEHAATAHDAAHEMAHAAVNLWASLSEAQRKQVGFAFDDPYRLDWHFIPRERKGLPWKEMTPEQRHLAQAMLASGLSTRGVVKVSTIMSLEQVLKEIEKGSGPVRDPELYFFTIYGNPGAEGHREPWGWRVEGHHLSLNFTIAGDHGSVAGPTFMGANPAEVRVGPRKGLRTLAEEEDLARELVTSLKEDQRSRALVSAEAPKDILTANIRKASPLEPAGIRAGELTGDQLGLLMKLVHTYADRLRPELAAQDIDRIVKAGIEKIGFAWAGPIERGQPHYYRIQGPTFLIEYDNTQNNANHVHSVWRDFSDDFGEDLLRKHYEQHAHVDGEHKPK